MGVCIRSWMRDARGPCCPSRTHAHEHMSSSLSHTYQPNWLNAHHIHTHFNSSPHPPTLCIIPSVKCLHNASSPVASLSASNCSWPFPQVRAQRDPNADTWLGCASACLSAFATLRSHNGWGAHLCVCNASGLHSFSLLFLFSLPSSLLVPP
jgi:hypothetical protein